MIESQSQKDDEAVARAIALVEAALFICDEHAFIFAAIDLSSAHDKLLAFKKPSSDD